MSGKETRLVPQFMEGKPLPPGYFDDLNPYESHPSCKIDFHALGDYVYRTGKRSGWDLSKEEMKMFEPEPPYSEEMQ